VEWLDHHIVLDRRWTVNSVGVRWSSRELLPREFQIMPLETHHDRLDASWQVVTRNAAWWDCKMQSVDPMLRFPAIAAEWMAWNDVEKM
jgi:hypothetical protein